MAAKSDKTAATDGASSTLKATVKKATTRRKAPAISAEMIAERAYHISQSVECASDEENWLRAESELLSK